MSLSNFEKWRIYTDGLNSPDNYINWGWYYLISAALQRRVWCGPEHSPLYPNMYIILVGEPGVGKGLVIKQLLEYLQYHKLPDPREKKSSTLQNASATEQKMVEIVSKEDYDSQINNEEAFAKKLKDNRYFEKPLLLPLAADATTYEALIKSIAKSLRRKVFVRFDEELKKEVPDFYTHSSMCFCLEEISSLFRKRTEDLVHFLIQAYDCGDYTYDTKTQGKDKVKRCCLNFFGGTTPGFMEGVFDDKLLTEGFASRTFFIFAHKNRKADFWIPDLSEEQKQCKKDLLEHIGKVADLFGYVKFTDEADKFLTEWWKESQNIRPNTSLKLNPYYARKNIHVLKLSMSMHFSERTDTMIVGLPTVMKALEVLAQEEKNMHYCLGFDKANPLSMLTNKIFKFLQGTGMKFTFKELLTEHWNAIPGPDQKENLSSVLEHLKMSGKIIEEIGQHKITKLPVNYYFTVQKSDI